MSWTREQVSVLIDVYEEHPVLYNIKNSMYYNKGAHNYALQHVVGEICKIRPNTTVDMVKLTFNTLRTQFNKELAAITKQSSGSGARNCTPALWCFERLQFLKDHVATRSSWCSVPKPQSTGPAAQEDSSSQI